MPCEKQEREKKEQRFNANCGIPVRRGSYATALGETCSALLDVSKERCARAAERACKGRICHGSKPTTESGQPAYMYHTTLRTLSPPSTSCLQGYNFRGHVVQRTLHVPTRLVPVRLCGAAAGRAHRWSWPANANACSVEARISALAVQGCRVARCMPPPSVEASQASCMSSWGAADWADAHLGTARGPNSPLSCQVACSDKQHAGSWSSKAMQAMQGLVLVVLGTLAGAALVALRPHSSEG